MYKQGTIILVPFPFTDLSGEKVRPALILSNKIIGDDIVVCFISSKVEKKSSAFDIVLRNKQSDFAQTGLKVDSSIKVDKIATLDKRVILGELGELGRDQMSQVKKFLKIYLGI